MELGQLSGGDGMAIGEGEHFGGGRVRLDERIALHSCVGGAWGVIGRRSDGAIEDAGPELFERESGFRGLVTGGWRRAGEGCVEGGPRCGGGCAALPGRGKLCEFAFGVTNGCCARAGGPKQRGFLARVFEDVVRGKLEADRFVECIVTVLTYCTFFSYFLCSHRTPVLLWSALCFS